MTHDPRAVEAAEKYVNNEICFCGLEYSLSGKTAENCIQSFLAGVQWRDENLSSPFCPVCGSCGVPECCSVEKCLYPPNRIQKLEAALERCKEQRDKSVINLEHYLGNFSVAKGMIESMDKELEEILK